MDSLPAIHDLMDGKRLAAQPLDRGHEYCRIHGLRKVEWKPAASYAVAILLRRVVRQGRGRQPRDLVDFRGCARGESDRSRPQSAFPDRQPAHQRVHGYSRSATSARRHGRRHDDRRTVVSQNRGEPPSRAIRVVIDDQHAGVRQARRRSVRPLSFLRVLCPRELRSSGLQRHSTRNVTPDCPSVSARIVPPCSRMMSRTTQVRARTWHARTVCWDPEAVGG